MKSKFYLLLFISLLTVWQANAQCRGTQPGELYFSLAKYYDIANDVYYNMIARTTDYGHTLESVYNYQSNTTDMPVGWVLADATPGVLYNQLEEGLYRSVDYGVNWEFVQPLSSQTEIYVTGNITDEIFRKTQGVLFKSADNGNSWIQQQTDLLGRIEVGNQLGEIYLIESYDNNPYDITLHHSIDDGVNFDSFFVNPNITGYKVSGNIPRISRGTIPGEFYLITWWLPANYKIYRSTDYGENFTLQYEQPDTCFFWDEVYQFTAGREPCEFYILKIKTWIDGYYNRLHIYYSNDCAQTFTEYVHVLDENWTGIDNLAENNNSFLCYPNPTTGQLSINNEHLIDRIIVTDITGKEILNIQQSTFNNQYSIDLTEQPAGIYFLTIQLNSNNETNFQTQKIIKL